MHGIKQTHLRHYSIIYITAVLISLCLSAWANIREVVINPDAICYLQSAQSMVEGVRAAMQLCDQAHWPFYSALIYGFATLTKIPYLYAAYLLDAIFSVP